MLGSHYVNHVLCFILQGYRYYSISSCMDEELFKHALFEPIEKLNNLGLNLKRKQLEALRSAKIFRKNPVKSFQ